MPKVDKSKQLAQLKASLIAKAKSKLKLAAKPKPVAAKPEEKYVSQDIFSVQELQDATPDQMTQIAKIMDAESNAAIFEGLAQPVVDEKQ